MDSTNSQSRGRLLAPLLAILLSACQTMPWDSTPPVEERRPEAAKPTAPPSAPATAATPEPVKQAKPAPAVVCEPPQQAALAEEKPVSSLAILGAVEKIKLDPGAIILRARIDTGATTSSLDARNIKQFERDGKPWVRFKLIDRKTKKETEVTRPIVRQAPIKGVGLELDIRPVIKMKATIGALEQQIELTLNDRSRYRYPVLIGRNFLKDAAIVDVSRRYTSKFNNSK